MPSMSWISAGRTARWAVAVLLVTVLAVGNAPAYGAANHRPIKVMTRNLYLGASFGRIVAAAGSCGAVVDFTCLRALANAAAASRSIVDRTDFPARAKLLAREIADADPALIGLQEVTLWRSGPLELGNVGTVNATTVEYDYLAILLRELRNRGLRYDVVVAQPQADIELPAFNGTDLAGGRDIRWTLHDVILRRADVAVSDHGGVTFPDAISVHFGAGPLTVVSRRGYVWADAIVNRRPLRFVNTHLDADSATLRALQAQALAAALAPVTNRTVVVVGDLNSDPLDASVTAPHLDPTPNNVAFQTLVSSGGFTDTWTAASKRKGAGPTAFLGELLTDADTSSMSTRIDHVLARPAAGGRPVSVQSAHITGIDGDNRTAQGLWASDHAGVVTTIVPQ